MNRRRFLQLMSLFAVTPLIKVNAQEARQIIVIGAGAAGLAAADRLHRAGHQVTVLEARDRIGGRVWTSYDMADHPVELGGEFLHGENLVTWDYLQRFGMEALKTGIESSYIYLNGEWLDLDDLPELPALEFENEVFDLAEQWVDDEEDDISLAQGLELWQEETGIEISPEERRLINHYFTGDYAADLEQLGAYGIAEMSFDTDEGDDFRVKDGYSALMQRLAEGLDIRLNSPVSSIEWSSEGVNLETETGEEFEADQVIITLPLGVLKADVVEFDPPLPQDYQDAIHELGAGHVDKIVLKFDAPFWDDFEEVITALDTQIWWRPGIGRENEAPILIALVGGEMAERFEAMQESEVIAAALHDLETLFEVENLAARLVESRFIRWGSDPYSRMGYSYVPVEAYEWREVFSEPVDHVLFFAGEATHVEKAGTVHGAIETGLRAADQILG